MPNLTTFTGDTIVPKITELYIMAHIITTIINTEGNLSLAKANLALNSLKIAEVAQLTLLDIFSI